jgi:hypothetical protein
VKPLTQSEFKTLLKGMKAVYNNPSFIPDDYAATIWYAALKDISYKAGTTAFQKYIMTETKEPKPADLRKLAFEDSGEMSELEAWDYVYRVVCNLSYEALTDAGELKQEFDRLPEAIRIAVGTPHMLKEWSGMDIDQVESVEQSHFIRGFRTAQQRVKQNKTLPESMRIGKREEGRIDEGFQALPADG